MKLQRTVLLIDNIFQGILMSLIIPGPVLSLVWGNNNWIFISLYGMVLLGAWQFLGNLGWMALTKEKARRYYFTLVAGYFTLGLLAFQLIPNNAITDALGFSYWFIFPFGIAIYYFLISAKHLVISFSASRSFWDL
ncbi:MAG: hypothetical protein IPJ40_21070 [Saprospirales bacterium]|nr:hypothetical protein [Saprospirales bacterium]